MNTRDKIIQFFKDRRIVVCFLFIIILASFLRLYKLDSVPPSLNWDEVDAGYNAYTIANWGRDEWGEFLPLVFTSFGDDKHPVHIYLSAPIIRLFGLSDFTTRLSGALIGILTVIVIFYLARIIFKSDLAALLSSLFLAVSPYHLHFSRGLWEINFALFFFMLGLLMFYLALYKKGWLISISFLSFGVSILSYHSSKIIVPSVLLLLIIIHIKALIRLSKNFYFGIVILIAFMLLLISNPRLLGFARVQQTQFGQDIIEKTQAFQKTKSHLFGLGEITFNQYLTHFSLEYLFVSGDQNPRNSAKTSGELYKIDALFILIGALYLLKSRSRVALVIFTWLLLAPIPSSLVSHAPNATRALFMMGSMQLITAFGASKILSWLKGNVRIFVLGIFLIVLGIETYVYLKGYFNVYPKEYAIEWQYGMKQASLYAKDHPEYSSVFVTNVRSQPYIFFLYYLKTPLPELLNSVIYNQLEGKSSNTVASFDKYFFVGWDPTKDDANSETLYVLSPSEYDGLKNRSSFNIKKVIYYPNDTTAFFVVSMK